MRVSSASVVVLLAVAAGTVLSGQSRSVWDGVYTEEQAQSGVALYGERCALCHGASLGSESAPALIGPNFSANWEGVTLGGLLERMRVSMPLDDPGSLSRRQNAEVLAYMLSVGQFPAGERPLPREAGALALITFRSNRPEP